MRSIKRASSGSQNARCRARTRGLKCSICNGASQWERLAWGARSIQCPIQRRLRIAKSPYRQARRTGRSGDGTQSGLPPRPFVLDAGQYIADLDRLLPHETSTRPSDDELEEHVP